MCHTGTRIAPDSQLVAATAGRWAEGPLACSVLSSRSMSRPSPSRLRSLPGAPAPLGDKGAAPHPNVSIGASRWPTEQLRRGSRRYLMLPVATRCFRAAWSPYEPTRRWEVPGVAVGADHHDACCERVGQGASQQGSEGFCCQQLAPRSTARIFSQVMHSVIAGAGCTGFWLSKSWTCTRTVQVGVHPGVHPCTA